MIAYQIVDFDNPISMEYSRISIESFQPAIEAGIFSEIIPVQCVTPSTLSEYEDMFTWHKSLTDIDTMNGQGEISPTERSGNISHWLLMKQAGETDERFFILEHDAYLLDVNMFKKCVDRMNQHEMSYANLGLFMSCYSYNKECAEWCWDLLVNRRFPINCGPYGVAERMFKTFADNYLRKRDYHNKHFTYMTHYKNCKYIGCGKTSEEMFETYNFSDDEDTQLSIPSTQVISKRLKVTQDHEGYAQHFLDAPWLRSKQFKIIE